MKYLLSESQYKLLKELKKRKKVREQDFIAQAYSPTINEQQKQTR